MNAVIISFFWSSVKVHQPSMGTEYILVVLYEPRRFKMGIRPVQLYCDVAPRLRVI